MDTTTMGEAYIVRVADFSTTPGPRYRKEGDFSGEEFREDYLRPAYSLAVAAGTTLTVDLEDTFGYASSFLDEVFGGLARRFGTKEVREHLRIKTDQPALDYEIRHYIEKPNLAGWATRDKTGFWTSITWSRASAEATARSEEGDGFVYPVYSGPGEPVDE